MKNKITTIQISLELKKMLSDIGKKEDTYESIIRRLLIKVGEQR